jgi:hypothetical protein
MVVERYVLALDIVGLAEPFAKCSQVASVGMLLSTNLCARGLAFQREAAQQRDHVHSFFHDHPRHTASLNTSAATTIQFNAGMAVAVVAAYRP